MARTSKNYLIISAHNESRNIGSVISRIPSDIDCVVIVDDGSSDETARIAHDFLERSKFKYVILKHQKIIFKIYYIISELELWYE